MASDERALQARTHWITRVPKPSVWAVGTIPSGSKSLFRMNHVLFAAYDAMGPAVMAAVCTAGVAIIGSYIFTYAAYVFFAILDATAGGQDELSWPDEPMLDWMHKGMVLAWLVLVSAGPSFIVGRAMAREHTSIALTVSAGCFAILFPLVVLSVQTAGSMFAVLYPPALGRMLRQFDMVIAFYLAATPVFAIGAAGLYGLHAGSLALGLVFAIAVAWAILTAARLCGRFAHQLTTEKRARKRSLIKKSSNLPLYTQRDQPESLPDDSDEGYGVRATNAIVEPAADRPSLKRLWIEDDDDGQPMALLGEAVKPLLPDSMLNPSEEEMRLAAPSRRPKPPAHLWTAGTYNFAFRSSSLGPMTWLSLGLTIGSWLWRPLAGME